MNAAPFDLPAGSKLTRLEQVATSLDARIDRGLSLEEASRRLANGRNELPNPPGSSWFQRIWRHAREPMSLLLLIAALVSGIALGEPRDALAIAAIVVLNVAVAVIQEERAATALEALRSAAAPTARVLRDGQPLTVPSAEVVPGDLVLLTAGDLVPADIWLTDAWSLEVNESLLTGESLPVPKLPASEGDMSLPVADRTWMVYGGSPVTAGSGRGLVVTTGSTTAVGRIAGHLTKESPATPLQKQLARLSARLGQAAVGIAAAVFVLIVLRLGGSPGAIEQAFLAAVALAVAAVPEGLPAVVTLSLALGVRRMARMGAIVRHLPAVETLGSTTVLLTDKTGTLTMNRMRLASVISVTGETFGLGGGDGPIREAAARVAALCSDATMDPPQGDPVEVALLEGLGQTEVERLRSEYPRVANLPFDSQRKMMSTLHRDQSGFQLLTKGAPEQVLNASRFMLTVAGQFQPLTEEARTVLLSSVNDLAGAGSRVLALAVRKLDNYPADLAAAENDLVLVGLAVLHDPLRPEAQATVQKVTEAGVHLVMVTGDHAGTASAIARAAGLSHDESEILTGYDLRADGLPSDLGSVRVYARVDPDQKLQLVEAFQRAGHVVAVTGDGVNDAPALRRADIGVAMGKGGSQVAREAADLVITDDDLNLVAKAVREGRSIFDNIRKVVDYLVAGNLSEVTVVLAGLAFFPSLGIPLLPLQLLWINLLTDGLPALALGFDKPRHDGSAGAARLASSQLLSGRRLTMLAARGLILASGAIGALVAIRATGGSWEQARTVMFSTLVVSHLLYAFVVRLPLREYRSNLRLTVAVGLGLALQAGIVLGPFRDIFDVVAIDGPAWFVCITTGILPVGLLAAVEMVRSRRSAGARIESNAAFPKTANRKED